MNLAINVCSDHCAAARSQPDWQPLGGDINLDCAVDQAGLDILLERWLERNALKCPEMDAIEPNVCDDDNVFARGVLKGQGPLCFEPLHPEGLTA